MIKNIIFDNDGVLVDTERLFFRACRETLAAIGVELTLPVYQDMLLRQGKSCMFLAEQVGYDAEAIHQLRLDRDVVYREYLKTEVVVPPGVYAVLEKWRGRLKMGVVTSTTREHFDLIHTKTGIPAYLDFVYTQEDFDRLKPFPDPFLLALRGQNLKAEETVVFEDTERGLTAAIAAGIRCFIVPTEVSRGCEFAGAFRVLERIDQALEIVGKM